MSKRNGAYLKCEVCNEDFYVPKNRLERTGRMKPRYCGRTCASVGRVRGREPWNKGKTKLIEPRLAAVGEAVSRSYAQNPSKGRGENHPMWGRQHSAESRMKMSKSQRSRPLESHNTKGLELGRSYFKGKTKETDEAVARRAQILAGKYKGVLKPEHGERMRAYYLEHPDKHPNRVLAQKGHETGIERAMRIALTRRGIAFTVQHPIGRYFADFTVEDARIVIEVDGERWHDAARDAKRDAELRALGWNVFRFSEHQVTRNVSACVDEIQRALT